MLTAPSGSASILRQPAPAYAGAARHAAFAVAIGAAYGAAILVSSSLRFEAYRVAIVWPAAGVLLAALIIAPSRRWPEIALACYVGWCLAAVPRLGYTLATALLFHLVMLAQIGAAVLVVRAGMRASGERLTDPWMLLLLAFALALFAFPGGVLRNLAIRGYLGLPIMQMDIGRSIAFALAVVLGALSLGPLLISVLDRDWRAAAWHRTAVVETVAIAIVAAAAALISPLYLPVVDNRWPVSLALPPLLVLIASLRVGLAGASACLVAYMLVAAWRAGVGLEPFSGSSAEANTIDFQLWLSALTVPMLAVATVFDERRRGMSALEQSEARARDLAGRLINAQEAERARIGRELHDNVGQLVSSLSIGLSRLKRRADADTAGDAAMLHERAAVLAEEVRRLSHGLHSGVLKHAGLAEAIRGLGDEVRELGHQVTVSVTGRLEPMPPSVQLCLFRVAQEALQNAVRHASMRSLDIALRVDAGRAELSVTDDGRGFAPEAAANGSGVGIASMRERVRLAGGLFTLASRPGQGTSIRAILPLAPPSGATQT